MLRRLVLPLVAFAAGCANPEPFDGASTVGDVVRDTTVPDLGPDPDRCTGALVLDLSTAPESLVALPVTWEEQEVVLTAEAHAASPRVRQDDDGCLVLSAGRLVLDVLDTGCAAERVALDLTERCPGACSDLTVFDDEGVQLGTTGAVPDGEGPVQLVLEPPTPFLRVAFETLDAVVCAVRLRRGPLPPELQPEDTLDAF